MYYFMKVSNALEEMIQLYIQTQPIATISTSVSD